jgi:hypothetical protein
VHDIAMTRFSQWWRRCVRTGFAYADGVQLHGKPPERHFVGDVRSALFWGIALPLFILVLAWPTRGASFVLLGGYLVLYWRIRRYASRRGWSPPDARLYALWCALSRFPIAVGVIIYSFRRVTRRPAQIIEYKEPEMAAPHGDPGSSISGVSMSTVEPGAS